MDGGDVGHLLGLLLHKITQCVHMRLGSAGTNNEIVKIDVVDFLEIEAVNVHSLFLKQRLNYQFLKVSLKRNPLIFYFSFFLYFCRFEI